jgi:uncharacterized SAM-dependent methyltransferase
VFYKAKRPWRKCVLPSLHDSFSHDDMQSHFVPFEVDASVLAPTVREIILGTILRQLINATT